jgi:hypothetical protein
MFDYLKDVYIKQMMDGEWFSIHQPNGTNNFNDIEVEVIGAKGKRWSQGAPSRGDFETLLDDMDKYFDRYDWNFWNNEDWTYVHRDVDLTTKPDNPPINGGWSPLAEKIYKLGKFTQLDIDVLQSSVQLARQKHKI